MTCNILDFAGAIILTSSVRFLTRQINRFGFFMKSEMLSKIFLC